MERRGGAAGWGGEDVLQDGEANLGGEDGAARWGGEDGAANSSGED